MNGCSRLKWKANLATWIYNGSHFECTMQLYGDPSPKLTSRPRVQFDNFSLRFDKVLTYIPSGMEEVSSLHVFGVQWVLGKGSGLKVDLAPPRPTWSTKKGPLLGVTWRPMGLSNYL